MTALMPRLQCFLFALLILAFPTAQDSVGASQSLQKFRVGVYENPPKVYINNSGEAAGIFPEILKIIADREKWELEFVSCSWNECLERLESNDLDIMPDIAYSEERGKKFYFSQESVFLNWATIYTHKDVAVNSLFDLNGRTIAAVKEDIHTVGKEGIEHLISKFELDTEILPVNSYHEALAMVEDGSVDGGVVNRLFGALTEREYEISKTPIVFNPVHLKFAFPQKQKYIGISRTIDKHIRQFKADPGSLFHKIINSYLSGVDFDLSFFREVQSIPLTEDEKQWLARHKVIRLGVDKGYAPYSFRNEGGDYQGIAVDIIHLVAKHLGVKIDIVEGLDWPQIIDYAGQRKLDAILTTVETPERREFLNFTHMYLPTPLVIMTKQDNQEIQGPEGLTGKKVALVNGYYSAEIALQDHPDIIPVMVQTPLDGLTAVSSGLVDCYIGVIGVCDYISRVNGITNLKIAARYDMLMHGERIATRKDWPELADILDKALGAITEKKRLELHQSWISALASLEGPALLQQKNALTAEETAWVKEHKEILLGVDPEFAPFEFIDETGQYTGIVPEYLQILEKRIGLNFEVAPGLSWKEAVEQVRQGKIDMLPCVGKTSERQKFLLFSKPYMYYQRVIITRTGTPFISSIDDIKGMRVAVQKETSHEGYLMDNTEVQPTLYATLQETLKAVSDGRADAMIGNLSSSIFWIRKENFTNLKIAGPVSYASEELHFAVHENLPELVGIVEKGLASLTSLQQKNIREKWVNVEYEPGLDPGRIFRYFLIGFALIFMGFGLFLFWNYRLKKEIDKRTGEVEKTNRQLLSEIQSREVAEADRKDMQNQLFQAQKIESIGTLAGGIAHDFNNILSSIIGYTEISLDYVVKGSKLEKNMQEVYKAGQRAKDLVKQILTIARKSDEEIKPIPVKPIIKEALKFLRSSIPTTIEIQQNITSESSIMGNPTQLHQIIMNLCTNAAHAMEESGGLLKVDLEDLRFEKHETIQGQQIKSGDYIKLRISDTGTGISPDVIGAIFDPYYTSKEPGEGTGLGLALVHSIVEKYGGIIEVSSELGQGSVFSIYLPTTKVNQTNQPYTKQDLPIGSERILFIDDEAAIAKIGSQHLEKLGYSVTIMTSSKKALNLFQSNAYAFDLVLTDMTMPGLTGDKLAVELMKIRQDMPVIVCTGYSKKISAQTAAKIGIKALVYKPLDRAELAKTVRKVLDDTQGSAHDKLSLHENSRP
ncbi:MAG: transporter substrate-binding domain-containing protein [Desulfotignum sp.]|nr:transporter substrate-binding domain-containing protein [Desulfotignum sp.]MCF8138148.1 transporter substrate-binding domain-containing protein [Desulfotignum sp.]